MFCYVVLCYVVLCCVMLCNVMLRYLLLCYVMLRCVMLCLDPRESRAKGRGQISCGASIFAIFIGYFFLLIWHCFALSPKTGSIFFQDIQYYVMLCYLMLCFVMSCYVTFYYVILFYVMLRCVMLCLDPGDCRAKGRAGLCCRACCLACGASILVFFLGHLFLVFWHLLSIITKDRVYILRT